MSNFEELRKKMEEYIPRCLDLLNISTYEEYVEWRCKNMDKTLFTYYERAGKIYFIREPLGGFIKIGYTEQDIKDRLLHLQTSHPAKLKLIAFFYGDESDEKRIHKKFNKFRVSGEWFRPSQELLDYIHDLEDSHIPDKKLKSEWNYISGFLSIDIN